MSTCQFNSQGHSEERAWVPAIKLTAAVST